MPNSIEYSNNNIKTSANFKKQLNRLPFQSKYPINAKRFNNINKDPSCLSRNLHKMSISFEKQSPRKIKDTFFSSGAFLHDYDQSS